MSNHNDKKTKGKASSALFDRGTIIKNSAVRKNEAGGVYVSPEEIASAFEYLDPEGTGKLTVGQLKRRLHPFFPDLTTKDYKYLMKHKKEIVIEDLHSLLDANEIKDFDPVAEAFKSYDPENKGFISKDKLKDIAESFGFGNLSLEEIHLLTKAADVDGDGIISLNDFKQMMDNNNSSSNQEEEDENDEGGGDGGEGGNEKKDDDVAEESKGEETPAV